MYNQFLLLSNSLSVSRVAILMTSAMSRFYEMLSAMAACVAVSTEENRKDFSFSLQFLGILGKCYTRNSSLILVRSQILKKKFRR